MEAFQGPIVILIVARTLGEFASRMRLPSILGEVVAGVLIGLAILLLPNQLSMFANITESGTFTTVVDMGIFFLMLVAGMEVKLKDMLSNTRKAIPVALGGILIPLIAGILLGVAFIPKSDLWMTQVFFLGVALAITAVPISIATLIDLGKLDSLPGTLITDAAIIDDVVGVALLAVLISMIGTGSAPSVAELGILAAKVAAFFAMSALLGRYVLAFLDSIIARTRAPEMHFTLILTFGGLLAVLSDLLGMHFMIGAFVGGIIVRDRIVKNTPIEQEVEGKLKGVTLGFLAPVFFASTGMHIDLAAFEMALWFTVILIAVAILTKILGCAIPARLAGVNTRESLAVGVGMSSRGGVELIIASVALQAGLFSQSDTFSPILASMYSAVIITAIVSTIVGPIGLRLMLGNEDAPSANSPPLPGIPYE